MNPKFEMLSPVPGYQEATPFLKVATFFGDDIYQTVPWEEYAKQ